MAKRDQVYASEYFVDRRLILRKFPRKPLANRVWPVEDTLGVVPDLGRPFCLLHLFAQVSEVANTAMTRLGRGATKS